MAVGSGKGRLRLNEQNRSFPTSPLPGPTFDYEKSGAIKNNARLRRPAAVPTASNPFLLRPEKRHVPATHVRSAVHGSAHCRFRPFGRPCLRTEKGRFGNIPLPRPLRRVRKNPASFPEEAHGRWLQHPSAVAGQAGWLRFQSANSLIATIPTRAEETGLVFKRSCRWLARVMAVGVGKGRLRVNERKRSSRQAPSTGPRSIIKNQDRLKAMPGSGGPREIPVIP